MSLLQQSTDKHIHVCFNCWQIVIKNLSFVFKFKHRLVVMVSHSLMPPNIFLFTVSIAQNLLWKNLLVQYSWNEINLTTTIQIIWWIMIIKEAVMPTTVELLFLFKRCHSQNQSLSLWNVQVGLETVTVVIWKLLFCIRQNQTKRLFQKLFLLNLSYEMEVYKD